MTPLTRAAKDRREVKASSVLNVDKLTGLVRKIPFKSKTLHAAQGHVGSCRWQYSSTHVDMTPSDSVGALRVADFKFGSLFIPCFVGVQERTLLSTLTRSAATACPKRTRLGLLKTSSLERIVVARSTKKKRFGFIVTDKTVNYVAAAGQANGT